jgi:ribonuclease HI
MELLAAIEALRTLKEPCEVEFFTDSAYVKNGVTKWLNIWKQNGWRTKAKAAVKNDDLWRLLDSVSAKHKVTWNWLKGHAGHDGNERCDVLANEAIARIRQSFNPEQLKEALAQFSMTTDRTDSNGELL